MIIDYTKSSTIVRKTSILSNQKAVAYLKEIAGILK
jgi:hypothetical protein